MTWLKKICDGVVVQWNITHWNFKNIFSPKIGGTAIDVKLIVIIAVAVVAVAVIVVALLLVLKKKKSAKPVLADGVELSNKKPVKNQDLWMQLDEIASQKTIHWVWVKGHAGEEMNERVDELARTAAMELKEGKKY